MLFLYDIFEFFVFFLAKKCFLSGFIYCGSGSEVEKVCQCVF